jgi:hypothetical protein
VRHLERVAVEAQGAPSTAAMIASWSMIPQSTPTARCSARRQSWAAATGSRRFTPSIVATATSSAALDDSPRPMGRLEWSVPVSPSVGRSSRTTAAT